MTTNFPPPVLVTGGARGADLLWLECARRCGMDVEVMSFKNHDRTLGSYGREVKVVELGDNRLEKEGAPWIRKAAHMLGRNYPSTKYVGRLMKRNVFQVLDADAVYAIGHSASNPTFGRPSVKLEGGTAWACQVYAAMCAEKFGSDGDSDSPRPINLFLLSIYGLDWYQASITVANGSLKAVKWTRVGEEDIPRPGGDPASPGTIQRFAGIGARDVDDIVGPKQELLRACVERILGGCDEDEGDAAETRASGSRKRGRSE